MADKLTIKNGGELDVSPTNISYVVTSEGANEIKLGKGSDTVNITGSIPRVNTGGGYDTVNVTIKSLAEAFGGKTEQTIEFGGEINTAGVGNGHFKLTLAPGIYLDQTEGYDSNIGKIRDLKLKDACGNTAILHVKGMIGEAEVITPQLGTKRTPCQAAKS